MTNGNLAALVERLTPWYDQLALVYPEGMREMFSIQGWLPLYGLLGPGFAGGGRLSDGGLQGVAYLEP